MWAERGVRIDLRRQEVRTLYQLYIEDIEDDEVLLPGSVEFTYLPEVTALVSRDDGLIEVTQERFMDVVAEAMTTFNISERAKLANLLREPAPRCTDYDSSDEDDDTISRTPMEIACDLEVLNRATSILTCYRCSLSSPTSYFPFTGITRHILKFHPDSSYKAISREKAVIGTASAVLEMLGLPSSTRYSDISRKIVCLCGKPDFQQPAKFSESVSRISLSCRAELCLPSSLLRSCISFGRTSGISRHCDLREHHFCMEYMFLPYRYITYVGANRPKQPIRTSVYTTTTTSLSRNPSSSYSWTARLSRPLIQHLTISIFLGMSSATFVTS